MDDQFYGFDVQDLITLRAVLEHKGVGLKEVTEMVREDEYEVGLLRGQLTIANAKLDMIRKVTND